MSFAAILFSFAPMWDDRRGEIPMFAGSRRGDANPGESGRRSAQIAPPPQHTTRDVELLRGMAANDEQALAELVAIHAQSLHDVAYMILRDSALAADAVQDVFIRMWHRRSALEVTGTVAGYLVRAVRNRALDIAKHERSQQRLARATTDQYVIDVATSHQGNPEMAAERSPAFTQAVDAAVRSLTPRVRETFLLALVQGMTYAEIGAALGVSVMTVQSQLSRAVAQLRRSLAGLRSD